MSYELCMTHLNYYAEERKRTNQPRQHAIARTPPPLLVNIIFPAILQAGKLRRHELTILLSIQRITEIIKNPIPIKHIALSNILGKRLHIFPGGGAGEDGEVDVWDVKFNVGDRQDSFVVYEPTEYENRNYQCQNRKIWAITLYCHPGGHLRQFGELPGGRREVRCHV